MYVSVSHQGFRLPVQSASAVHSTHVNDSSSQTGCAGLAHSLDVVHWTPVVVIMAVGRQE